MGSDDRYHRQETEDERLDRNLIELLNELRVALPGVQVLFASCSPCRSRSGSRAAHPAQPGLA